MGAAEEAAASAAAAAAVLALFVGGAPVGGIDGFMGLHLSGRLVPRFKEVIKTSQSGSLLCLGLVSPCSAPPLPTAAAYTPPHTNTPSSRRRHHAPLVRSGLRLLGSSRHPRRGSLNCPRHCRGGFSPCHRRIDGLDLQCSNEVSRPRLICDNGIGVMTTEDGRWSASAAWLDSIGGKTGSCPRPGYMVAC
ncbi:hypothetical protein OsI_08838 [Oryza sativa Indica Group]|uniref:Uncharacterized protein n=1 Tax=Oryza sativa subsp. indica TaxID=39946 RepID=A2X9C0_ORYSI|nr:hypothetical protein OsI_08838 [Oryza sativa Indica Group]